MENMENKENKAQTTQTQQPTPTQQKVDTSMDPVVIFGGIAMMVIGVMMVVKGISVYIPAMGPVRGGLFPLVGLIVVAAGVFFFTMPRRRKKKEQAQKEAAGKE